MKFKGLCQVQECRAEYSEDCTTMSDPACYLLLSELSVEVGEREKPKSKVAFSYISEVETGQRYRDPDTGFTGVATAVHFYQHGCERVSLRCMVDHRIVDFTFDAPGLEPVAGSSDLGFSTGREADSGARADAVAADVARHLDGR